VVEKISRCLLRFLVAFFIIIVFVSVVFVLNGNLIVEDGGNLTFRKVILKMNCTYNGQYNITVKPGGSFYVLEGSVITSANPDKRYAFTVWSTFRMNNSELHECGWHGDEWAWGLSIACDDAIVENSLLSHSEQGIVIWNDGAVVCNNNITANNHVGIAVWGCSPIINDNHISSNYGGIHAGTSSPTIANNTITSNSGEGICFWDEANPIIQDNIITLNGIGIVGSFDCSPIIQGNNITSNNELGIVLKPNCTGMIQGNIIANNSDGIHLGDYCSPLIQGNIIKSNRDVGVRCAGNSLPEIHWNNIYDNENLGVGNDDPSVIVNATHNYWGDGPSPSSHVLYDPWLTESIFFAEITSPLSGETVSSTFTVSIGIPFNTLKLNTK